MYFGLRTDTTFLMTKDTCPGKMHIWRPEGYILPHPDDICLCGKLMWGDGLLEEDKILLNDGRCSRCGRFWDDHPVGSVCKLVIR